MDGDGDSGGVSSDESTTAGSILAGKNNQDKGVSPEVSSPFPAAVDDGSQHARYLLTGKELENPKLSKSLSPSSVVGWPPLRRSHRLAFHTKSPEEQSTSVPDLNEDFKTDAKEVVFENGYHPVKVNMDGTLYGRKVDLNAHNSYETLSQTLEDMFCEERSSPEEARRSKLLDATSEFVLTYEDKDGNRMLVGDVPWRHHVVALIAERQGYMHRSAGVPMIECYVPYVQGLMQNYYRAGGLTGSSLSIPMGLRMFLQSVKRLRIMRNYEYTRLGDRKRTIASPTCQEKKTRTGI